MARGYEMLRLPRASARQREKTCRVRRCREKGFNRYCAKHTPRKGVGLLKCYVCGKPYAEHEIATRCPTD